MALSSSTAAAIGRRSATFMPLLFSIELLHPAGNPPRSLSLAVHTEARATPSPAEVDLRDRIFRLRYPRRSAAAALERWREEGGRVTAGGLRRIMRELMRAKRYDHALEVFTWFQSKHASRILPSDHAMGMELIVRIHGLDAAESNLEKMQDSRSKKAVCLPLLHAYVKERDVEKAENLMVEMQRLGLLVTVQPYIEMMKLYASTNQSHKVVYVVHQMKRGMIPHNILSYNLWLNACWETSGVSSVERVYKEMVLDKNVEVGWSTYATMANIYTRASLHCKAISALRAAEGTLSFTNRFGYFYLITLYANLNDKEGVTRVWKASKKVPGRVTCANYMCIILCLVKVDDVEEAERVFKEWESGHRKYDVRVSNVLLGAYVRKGWIDKAESLHAHALENGGIPNYKTWEILMEGWVKSEQMDKAVDAMKKGFSMLKRCQWRPSITITMAIADYFEDHGNVKDAAAYLSILRKLNLASLPLYKAFIRTHIRAQTCAPDVRRLMEDDIDWDQEMLTLLQRMSRFSKPVYTVSGITEAQAS